MNVGKVTFSFDNGTEYHILVIPGNVRGGFQFQIKYMQIEIPPTLSLFYVHLMVVFRGTAVLVTCQFGFLTDYVNQKEKQSYMKI